MPHHIPPPPTEDDDTPSPRPAPAGPPAEDSVNPAPDEAEGAAPDDAARPQAGDAARPVVDRAASFQADGVAGRVADEATEIYAAHRELLFSIVYNLLGSVADTEDVLQDTWLAWAAHGLDGVEKPRAYLVRIAVNTALARQAAVARRRETYPGPWLPEPLVGAAGTGFGAGSGAAAAVGEDAAEDVARGEAVSLAMLVVLETLTPLSRAVFILHEVFGYPHTEIAEILDRSPASVRQVAHRAKLHVQARRTRRSVDPRTQREATERFLSAALGGDLAALMRILAPDVTMWSDGGGVRRAALRPVEGRDKVARFIAGSVRRRPEDLDVRYRTVNGDPSAVLFEGDAPFAVMVLDMAADGEHVEGIYAVSNPDKLTHLVDDEPDG
ncbi:sigma-70 family RNA polymerase sigma factor [Actinomadura logoneensis]|uniref:Sigma-70 family RNA polymerase sigma factor n=1 Tax=Actinomadura logoneensis TaxID=2293572 RepID=A0A372JL89_9ACTN|nr:RNA polymerase sigma factor SigJ [Actinomadura logoneensis]RFU40699.1 sigma-70 family RNA polymerase sigma factor [Actinomadura logoneensis]